MSKPFFTHILLLSTSLFLIAGCQDSGGGRNSGSTPDLESEQGEVVLSRCAIPDDPGFDFGVEVTGTLDKTNNEFSCLSTHTETLHDNTNGVQSYRLICSGALAERVILYFKGFETTRPFQVSMPWSNAPNVAIKLVNASGDFVEQNQLEIDTQNLEFLRGVIFSFNPTYGIIDGGVAQALSGCVEGEFKAVGSKKAASFKIRFGTTLKTNQSLL